MRINLLMKSFLNSMALILFLTISSTNNYASTHLTIEEIDDDADISSSSHSIPVKMPFKLGFEFQEENGLCLWGLNDITLQKKPIFKIFNNKNELWHVVIDGEDIEYVTRPFSYKEEEDLILCMNTLLAANDLLKALLKEGNPIHFAQWKSKIEEQINTFPLFSLEVYETFNLIKDQFFTPPHPKIPLRFSPQVTIQHPLEWSIPLYFALFGFDSPYMFNLSASLPFRGQFLKAQKEGDARTFEMFVKAYSTQKLNGLVFLNALTLVRMAPLENLSYDSIKEKIKRENSRNGLTLTPEQEEEAIIKETTSLEKEILENSFNYLTMSHQVDAKMQLMLMSRRPFSSMLADLDLGLGPMAPGKYVEFFKMVMRDNCNFEQVPILFNSTHYGEQFFDDHGKPKSLQYFQKLFREDFLERHKDVITKLLELGVVTTTMIRNFKEDVLVDGESITELLENYYEEVLSSVQAPQNRVIIDSDSATFSRVIAQHDALSPPWFLQSDNSMGAYNSPMSTEEKEFGEAIVEIRAIPHVGAWFLKKCNLDKNLTGLFLKATNIELITHVRQLFTFLRNFGDESDYTGIFYLGMPVAVKDY